MFHPLITCLLLSTAAGLSMRRFVLPYFPGGDPAQKRAPITIVANAVFLAAIAFIVSDQQFWAMPVVISFSLLLASIVDDTNPNMTIAISAISLAAYLGLRSD
jgi:hypothetical protein